MKIPIQVIRLSILGVFLVTVVAVKTITSSMAEDRIDKILSKLPEGSITYDSVSTDFFGLDVRINDIKINMPGQTNTIDEIVIKSIDNDNDIPNYLDIEINGMNVDIESLKMNRQIAKTIDILEYKSLKADLAISYAFDEDEETLNIKNISYLLEDAGELSMNAKVYGLKSFNDLQTQMMLNPKSIKISNSSIKYDDNSLTERLIKLAAHEDGVSVGTYKEKVLSELSKQLKKSEDKDDKFEIEILEEVITYWKNPESFEISISPKEAISFYNMQRINNAKEFVETVNLDISAN